MLLGSTSITIQRPGAGSYVDGEWSEATGSSFIIHGSPQPLTDREIQLLPEGVRSRAKIKLFVERHEPALVCAGVDSNRSDRVVLEGISHEVHALAVWTPAIQSTLAHRAYVLVAPEGRNGT